MPRTTKDRIKSIRALMQVALSSSSGGVVGAAIMRELDTMGLPALSATLAHMKGINLDLALLRDHEGATLLHRFVESPNAQGERRFAKRLPLLLAAGFDVNAVNSWSVTPLHLAASAPAGIAVKALLKHGANVEMQNAAGRTPLFYASPASAQALLAAGAAIEARDHNGADPVQFHLEQSQVETSTLLRGAGASFEGVRRALQRHEDGFVVLQDEALDWARAQVHQASLEQAVSSANSVFKPRL